MTVMHLCISGAADAIKVEKENFKSCLYLNRKKFDVKHLVGIKLKNNTFNNCTYQI